MNARITNYEMEIRLDKEISGLPDRIIIRSNDSENPYVWIYTNTLTTTYDKIPPRKEIK